MKASGLLRFSQTKDLAVLRGAALYHAVKNDFPELELLLGTANETSESFMHVVHPDSFSKRFSGGFNREFDRAWSGFESFRQAYYGSDEDYQAFIKPQPGKHKLQYSTFRDIHHYTRSILHTQEDFRCASWSVLFNDLGKYDCIHQWYRQHEKNSKENHDEVLARLLEKAPHYFDGFSRLSPEHKKHIIDGFGSACEIAQFVQLERPLSSLAGLKRLNKRTRELYVLHSVFDVAGALGDKFPGGSFVMNENTWTGFKLAIEAFTGFDQNQSIETVYNHYVRSRGNLIGINLSTKKDMALIKLACSARYFSPEDADILIRAWNQLSAHHQTILEEEYSEPGTEGKTPILVGYAPAMIANALGYVSRQSSTHGKDLTESKVEAIGVALTHIARVFEVSRQDIQRHQIKRSLYVGDAAAIAKSLNHVLFETLSQPLILQSAGYGSDVSFQSEFKPKSSL